MGELKGTSSGSSGVLPHAAPSGFVSAAGQTSSWQWVNGKTEVVCCGIQKSKLLFRGAWILSIRTKLSLDPGCRSSLTFDLRECSRETRTNLLVGGKLYSDQYEVEMRVKLGSRRKELSMYGG